MFETHPENSNVHRSDSDDNANTKPVSENQCGHNPSESLESLSNWIDKGLDALVEKYRDFETHGSVNDFFRR